MNKAKVNDQFTFDIEEKNGKLLVNGEAIEPCIQKSSDGSFHIIHDFKSYNVDIENINMEEKAFDLLINGTSYSVQMQDRFDLLLKELGMSALAGSKVDELKAPMPGLVLNVHVENGQEVQKGDPVLVLEAMKMENVLKAPGDGVIKTVNIQKGDAVEKNQVLIVME